MSPQSSGLRFRIFIPKTRVRISLGDTRARKVQTYFIYLRINDMGRLKLRERNPNAFLVFIWVCSSPGRTRPLQGRGSRFESDQIHHRGQHGITSMFRFKFDPVSFRGFLLGYQTRFTSGLQCVLPEYKLRRALDPQLADWPRGANPTRCLRDGRKRRATQVLTTSALCGEAESKSSRTRLASIDDQFNLGKHRS